MSMKLGFGYDAISEHRVRPGAGFFPKAKEAQGTSSFWVKHPNFLDAFDSGELGHAGFLITASATTNHVLTVS